MNSRMTSDRNGCGVLSPKACNIGTSVIVISFGRSQNRKIISNGKGRPITRGVESPSRLIIGRINFNLQTVSRRHLCTIINTNGRGSTAGALGISSNHFDLGSITDFNCSSIIHNPSYIGILETISVTKYLSIRIITNIQRRLVHIPAQ